MSKLKVLTIIGTRPEAIKLAPVILELDRRPEDFLSRVCVTRQHRELLDDALIPFGIQSHHDLSIMTPDQSLAQVTARAVEGLEKVIVQERPDVVLTQGDTTTAFCGALVAFYHRVKVGHVEAGLRTDDKFAPYPEEINRRLIGQLADCHFAPTENAKRALLKEGIFDSTIFVTGNTVVDALLWIRAQNSQVLLDFQDDLIRELDGRQLILVTGHRRESFGEGFENICRAIRRVADAFEEVVFVYPVHLNPNVRAPVNRILGRHPRIRLIEPLPYNCFVWLMDRAAIVLTDSGGVQEEAPSLGKPVLVMRETTERSEGIQAGNAQLVGVREEQIASALERLLQCPEKRDAMARVRNPYGDGQAAKRIVDILAQAGGHLRSCS